MHSLSVLLPRGNIADELVNQLRNMIVDGELAAGERINEVHLSRALGVSRTPLREALARLGHEGSLVGVPRIGWFVKPLSLEEFDQLYPIRALLDPAALRLAGLPPPGTIEALERLNRRLLAARDADAVIGLDDEWHLMLIGHCPNKVLIDLIRDMMRRTRRYEIALMRERGNVAVAADVHREIMDALGRGQLDWAVEALGRNLTEGVAPIRAWLAAREEAGR